MEITILHLSDLHFGTVENAEKWHSQLKDDLKIELQCKRLDGLILSGDIADFSLPDEYEAACGFIEKLGHDFGLSAPNMAIVPGNHDLNWTLAKKATG